MSEDLPVPVGPKNSIVKLEDDILILYQFWDFDNISISKYSNLIVIFIFCYATWIAFLILPLFFLLKMYREFEIIRKIWKHLLILNMKLRLPFIICIWKQIWIYSSQSSWIFTEKRWIHYFYGLLLMKACIISSKGCFLSSFENLPPLI